MEPVGRPYSQQQELGLGGPLGIYTLSIKSPFIEPEVGFRRVPFSGVSLNPINRKP